MQKVVVLSKASEDKNNHVARRDGRLDFPHERDMEITPPPEVEELMEAMESMPLPQIEDTDAAVETTPPPEVVHNLVEAIKDGGGTPPPELEELVKLWKACLLLKRRTKRS